MRPGWCWCDTVGVGLVVERDERRYGSVWGLQLGRRVFGFYAPHRQRWDRGGRGPYRERMRRARLDDLAATLVTPERYGRLPTTLLIPNGMWGCRCPKCVAVYGPLM